MSGARALQALAALLSYPTEALIDGLPEIREALGEEPRIGRRARTRLAALAGHLAGADLLDAQEAYVALFDRGRATSLNLFEHLHGDSRDRGQAMVDLARKYEDAGLTLEARELPDHLPVLLEYLSTRPREEAREMLADCAHILRSIGAALERRESPYGAVIAALLAIAGEPGIDAARDAALEAEEKALDEEWAEAPVLFGLGCGDARAGSAQAQPIRFMKRPA